MVEDARSEALARDDVIEQNGTLFRITAYRNANKYPMSIRTAAWSLTVEPETIVVDRNNNNVTTKKLLSYVGPGQLSVDKEVISSLDNFLRGDETTDAEITEEKGKGVDPEPKTAPVETDATPSDETTETETQPDDKGTVEKKTGLNFKSMNK